MNPKPRLSSSPLTVAALFILTIISLGVRLEAQESNNVENEQPVIKIPKAPPPSPIATASYLSLDGLTLVIVFDRPVNLSTSIESVYNRWGPQTNHTSLHWIENAVPQTTLTSTANQSPTCQLYPQLEQGHHLYSKHLIQGIQICARLLSKKTLKLLHKLKLRNCIWSSRVQFIVQLSKPASGGALRISFQRNTISEHGLLEGQKNEREITLELSKLPLEGLGVPLTPRLALTGPNQVPICGHFTLSAHLSSPFGTLPGDSAKLSWSVERFGSFSQNASDTQAVASNELKWETLRMLVNSNKANNLILASELLQFSPQTYKFRLSVQYSTSLSSVTLNATHQVTRIDFDAPVGTIYGSHLLGQESQVNTNQDLMLLADIQVPSCANNIKQVGLYWQVSDPKVKFEQTYAPYYLANANTLPEQSLIEFRLNAFYGIRVKKFASAHTLVTTGDSVLDSSISDGQLVVSLNQQEPSDRQLELYGSLKTPEQDKYVYQWSCFDGKTAQSCFKSLRSLPNNGTRYEIGALQVAKPLDPTASSANQQSGVTLIDRQNHRQSILKIPLNWLDHDAQLWFGLQRSDRLNPGQPSKTEYTLVSVQSNLTGPTISIGPVLIGQSRHRVTLRNPLTGAMILVANTPAVIVGRLGPSRNVNSFSWQSPNQIQPLHWTVRNTTNPLTGVEEILTELHLNQRQQVAYGHQQIQLVACSDSGARVKASLNLDIVQGVSQCRVEVSQSSLLNSLVISVNYCNIPLGLSPITYQIHLVDTSSSEGFIEMNNQRDETSPSTDDDYINETDEEFLEDLAQPLTMPQLSPIVALNGFNAINLLALVGNGTRSMMDSKEGQLQAMRMASVRFAARVCDRLQSCQMFYSAPVNARSLLSNEMQNNTGGQLNNNPNNRSLPLTELLAQQDSRQSLVAIIDSLQGMIESARRANLAGNSIAALSILNSATDLSQRVLNNADSMDNFQLNRAKNLLMVAMRDSLQYGSISIQRQFHYTDSGQTNLMTQTMSRIVASPTGGVDLKFKAMRLITMLTRRSIQEQLALKVNCLAEPKFIQTGYESLFGAFSHYSLEPSDKHSHGNHSLKYPALVSSLTAVIGNNSAAEAAPTVAALQGTPPAPTASSSKKRREEAILAYLRSVRQAYRSLLSAAAIQLPLGDSRQFRYFSEPQSSNILAEPSDVKPVSANSPGIEIVSSITHLTELPSRSLVSDLGESGSITVSLDDRLLSRIKANALNQGPRLRCRNDTITKCSSLVLALTTFTGKSPFRSLDQSNSLRAPVVEINLLSPVDGSNIVDLMPNGRDFITSVTFVFPRPSAPEESTSIDRPYRCYQFDEDVNEWSQSVANQADEYVGVIDSSDQDQTKSSLRCVFRGLGTFGAFQGKPPPDEASMRSAMIAALSALVVVIILFIVLGCFASSSKSKRAQSSDSSSNGGDSPQSKRHPEQTYRSGFNNYPL